MGDSKFWQEVSTKQEILAPVSIKDFMGSPFIETLMVFFSTGMMTLTFLGDEFVWRLV